MIYRGKVRGGVVVLPPEIHLPDGAAVTVELEESELPVPDASRFAGSLRNGVPVFPKRDSVIAPNLEWVNRIRDETL